MAVLHLGLHTESAQHLVALVCNPEKELVTLLHQVLVASNALDRHLMADLVCSKNVQVKKKIKVLLKYFFFDFILQFYKELNFVQ